MLNRQTVHESELTDEQEEALAAGTRRKHRREETTEDRQWLTRMNTKARQYGALKMSTSEGQLQRKQTERHQLEIYQTARDRWINGETAASKASRSRWQHHSVGVSCSVAESCSVLGCCYSSEQCEC